MNNKTKRAAHLLADLTRGIERSVNDVMVNADLIDNFCDNMPDDSIVYVSPYSHAIYFTVTGDTELLAQAVRYFRTRGFVTEDKDIEEKTAEARFEFTGWMADGSSRRIVLSWTSTVCKMVQVGTKQEIREVPVYELQCGDEPPTDESESQAPVDQPQPAYDGPMEPSE